MPLSNLVEGIYRAIPREEREGGLRLSSIGQPCERRLWYSVNTPGRAEPIAGAQKLRFEYGNLIEKQLLRYIRDAGFRIELEQFEVEIEGIKGHIDCLINGCLVDIKSASKWAFRKFNGRLVKEDPFGYLGQISAYHYALRDHPLLLERATVYFLAVDKSSGVLRLDPYPVYERDYGELVRGKKALVAGKAPPCRAYEDRVAGAYGNRTLGEDCSYCPFKRECWGDLEAFEYAGRTVYFTKVVRRPRVPESGAVDDVF